jgi:hypothetical protein
MGEGPYRVTKPYQTPNAYKKYPGHRQREISSVVERERAQIVS